LVSVGDNRKYYISDDQRVYGYIDYGDVWLGVSPSWSAHFNGQDINTQVKAAGDLVANPSGNVLYYRGIDGLIYRYIIDNDWSYTYSPMPTNSAMIAQDIGAIGSLVCATDSRLYYVAREFSNNDACRVHGFINQNGSWVTVSPSWSAHFGGQDINTQVQASGVFHHPILAADPSVTTLYYRGWNGLVYRYHIISDVDYTYSEMPTNGDMVSQDISVAGSLICATDDRIYYVAMEAGNNFDHRIHGFIRSTGVWNTVSPSWSAHFAGQNIGTQKRAMPLNGLAYGPNDDILAYVGDDMQAYGFVILNNVDYQYFPLNQTLGSAQPNNSLRFDEVEDLFYVSNAGDRKVHYFSWSPHHCGNPAVKAIEPNLVMKQWGSGSVQDSLTVTSYPNPTNGPVSLQVPRSLAEDTRIQIANGLGQIIRDEVLGVHDGSRAMDLTYCPAGLYVITITDGEQRWRAKLMRQ
jgi:hypothetical protein